MPKKRQSLQFQVKPQPAAPAALRSSSSGVAGQLSSQNERSVNTLLAESRRSRLTTIGPSVQPAPSVPPQLRQILRLPETPTPRPRRPVRSRRDPAGPPAPRSWLAASVHAPRRTFVVSRSSEDEQLTDKGPITQLPGQYKPATRSLIGLVLKSLAVDWEFHRAYYVYYFYQLPDHLKEALIASLVRWRRSGITIEDLRVILSQQLAQEDEDGNDCGGDAREPLEIISLNDNVRHLDVSGAVGRTMTVKELSSFLFPATAPRAQAHSETAESWEDTEIDISALSIQPKLVVLPALTHLSLAIEPSQKFRPVSAFLPKTPISWKQLLAFASYLPTLTHLSLAYWPEPNLTPNAKFAKVNTADGRAVQYGGTGPYSHLLHDDWSEAVVVLRKLSRELYGLEWLDLTGCANWATALTWSEEVNVDEPGAPNRATRANVTLSRNEVDWVGSWGKIETIVSKEPVAPQWEWDGKAMSWSDTKLLLGSIESRIRKKRGGKGRRFEVLTEEGS